MGDAKVLYPSRRQPSPAFTLVLKALHVETSAAR
jgi:hypothetical protein